MAVVYHWRHGWIPLDHDAAMEKSGGDKQLAAKMLDDAKHAEGIKTRQDIAKATLDLPNVRDARDRLIAHGHILEAHDKLNSRDLALETWLKTRPRKAS